MNRTQRAALAQETLTILQSGHYDTPTGRVDLHESLGAACAGTLLYRPHEAEHILAALAPVPGSTQTTITVCNQTTLAAAEALSSSDPSVACLNFASAKHPGGGFLSGSEAQEESLARASGLYATLQTQSAFYDYHHRHITPLYSDHLIFSPAVPVFRNDACTLLAQPWRASFITAAAVNAGVLRQQQRLSPAIIEPTMLQRTGTCSPAWMSELGTGCVGLWCLPKRSSDGSAGVCRSAP
jgi:uncharacterized protein (TIGR02452 family)